MAVAWADAKDAPRRASESLVRGVSQKKDEVVQAVVSAPGVAQQKLTDAVNEATTAVVEAPDRLAAQVSSPPPPTKVDRLAAQVSGQVDRLAARLAVIPLSSASLVVAGQGGARGGAGQRRSAFVERQGGGG